MKLIKIDLNKCLHNINIEMYGLQHGRPVPQTRMHLQFTFPILSKSVDICVMSKLWSDGCCHPNFDTQTNTCHDSHN